MLEDYNPESYTKFGSADDKGTYTSLPFNSNHKWYKQDNNQTVPEYGTFLYLTLRMLYEGFRGSSTSTDWSMTKLPCYSFAKSGCWRLQPVDLHIHHILANLA